MIKRLGLAACLAALLLAAVPSLAQAAWTHKGKGELKANAALDLQGTLTLATAAGDVACPAELETTLTGSSSAGHVEALNVSNPSECDLTGALKTLCGTNGLTDVEQTGTWALAADEGDITLTSIDLDYTFAGCLIPSVRLKGAATLSLDKATAIGSATLSGTQTLYNGLGEEAGSAQLQGTLAAAPGGTYGVKTAATVETRWTDDNENLSSDGQLTLTGSFSFSGEGGSISCPATIELQLESSTVEEEEPEGEVESFVVSKPAECDLTGGYKTVCGTNAVAEVEMTGTATLTTTASQIQVSGLALDYEFEKCAITSLKVEGGPTISVTSPEAISSATFSAGGLEVFNSKGEKLGTASAGGSASASPAATYQLVEDTHHEETTAHEATTHAEATAHAAETAHAEVTTAHEEATAHESETAEISLPFGGAYWTHGKDNGKEIAGFSAAKSIHTEGAITSEVGALQTTAELTFAGKVWNDAHDEMGSGYLGATVVGQGTVAGVPPELDCTVDVTLGGTPWDVTLGTDPEGSTTDASLEIQDATFVNHYNQGCQEAGTPAVGAATGNVQLTLESTVSGEEEHIAATIEQSDMTVYNPATGQHVEVEGQPVPVGLTSSPDPLTLTSSHGGLGVERHEGE